MLSNRISCNGEDLCNGLFLLKAFLNSWYDTETLRHKRKWVGYEAALRILHQAVCID